ncbi:MFS transporter [Escherichia coli]|uniref:MFS transporter n=1 Tax=Escherichia coli TaxID=562 RepID=UPI0010C317D6|nr:MFS transporter [Escherichia coli]GDJ59142.1 transporter [Escherichia coli]
MQHNSYRRWITLAIISFSGGVSFDLAYLRYIYQIPMAKFMGFSNTEIGLIMSTFGIAAIILYAPSGVIADKFSHRKMITSAMIITGLLGLLMATYPPLWVMLCIQVAFAITTILMLWSVSIKAASLLGDHSEQGKIMGWMEGLRGVGVMSLVAASYMGIVINKIFRALCGPLGGIITTYSKVKSPTRVIQILSVLGLLALTALLVTNSNPQSVAMGIGLILLLGFTCYASRGLYWACPGEARTPSYIMGTTVGICSVIGFLPDVFVYPIIGHWQDTLPAAEAYRNMWLMGMAALGMVIVFTFLLFQKIRTADIAPTTANSK